MMEEQPAPSAEEVGAVEDGGGAQAGAGTWALPLPNMIRVCPKCGPTRFDEDGEDTSRLHVTYHMVQQPLDPTRSPDVQLRENPCALLDPSVFPNRLPDGRGGEHLCVTCIRCHFGWAERVLEEGPVYLDLGEE